MYRHRNSVARFPIARGDRRDNAHSGCDVLAVGGQPVLRHGARRIPGRRDGRPDNAAAGVEERGYLVLGDGGQAVGREIRIEPLFHWSAAPLGSTPNPTNCCPKPSTSNLPASAVSVRLHGVPSAARYTARNFALFGLVRIAVTPRCASISTASLPAMAAELEVDINGAQAVAPDSGVHRPRLRGERRGFGRRLTGAHRPLQTYGSLARADFGSLFQFAIATDLNPPSAHSERRSAVTVSEVSCSSLAPKSSAQTSAEFAAVPQYNASTMAVRLVIIVPVWRVVQPARVSLARAAFLSTSHVIRTAALAARQSSYAVMTGIARCISAARLECTRAAAQASISADRYPMSRGPTRV